MNSLRATRGDHKVNKELIVLLFGIFLIGVVSAIPQTLNIQGKLTNGSDGNVLAGTYNINFSIYNATTAGVFLWSQNHSVTTDGNGFYSVILSGVDVNFSEQYYLGVAVEDDVEMVPRINLTSAPYTFRTNVTDALDETRNYSMGERLTFKFGEFIDNIIEN